MNRFLCSLRQMGNQHFECMYSSKIKINVIKEHEWIKDQYVDLYWFDLIDKEICIMKYTCVTVPPGAVAVPLKLKLKDETVVCK